MSDTKNTTFPKFEELNVSTMTVMCYSNIAFNTKEIFNNIKVDPTDPSNIILKGKKRILESSHEVVSVQQKIRVRGANLGKVYKYHCPKCLKYNAKNKPVNTVIQLFRPVKDSDELEPYWECKDCKTEFPMEQIKTKKIDHFLNQMTIVTTLNTNIINIMVFKDSLKIVGCRSVNDAMEVVKFLWADYISPIETAYEVKDENPPTFLFEQVMTNVGFNIGFDISQRRLNILMNEQHTEKIHMSFFDPAVYVHVSVKMSMDKPEEYKFDVLRFVDGNAEMVKFKENPFARPKKDKANYNTFIVFSTAETILSGRYLPDMKEKYEYFMKTVFENRDFVEA